MRMSKQTGKMYGSEEEYLNQVVEPAFERIRRYGKGKGDDAKDVTDRRTLLDYIQKVTGSSNKGLSDEIIKTDDYQKLVEDNFASSRKEEHIYKKDVAIAQPHRRTYYQKLKPKELIQRRAALRRELSAIDKELNARSKGKRRRA